MDKRNPEATKQYLLQNEEARKRIAQSIVEARENVTVTISRVCELFGFTENQLREWEYKDLLKPEWSKEGNRGLRLYPLHELEKLAIIRELIGHARLRPSEIPLNLLRIWNEVSTSENVQASPSNEQQVRAEQQSQVLAREDKLATLPINLRVDIARAELFWRYYASHALRLSLMLICDELPNTPAGLVLPLQPDSAVASVHRVEDLPKLGESLVGWLSKTHSSHTSFTPRLSFQYSTDYSLLPLTVMKDDEPLEQPKDNTFIVLDRLDRRSRALSLRAPIVETIRHLLTPLYGNAQILRSYFGPGMRDELDPAPNLDSSADPDSILDGLAEMVIWLSGQTRNGQEHRPFCCILLPKDSSLPLQQRTLVVRAQSQHSPHKVGGTTVSPDKSVNSLSLRAYQSGHVIYRPKITPSDTSIAQHQVEGLIQSAIAVPIGGENGPAIAVLYIASYERGAFPENVRRVLRMVGRMIEEAILTYSAREQVASGLINAIDNPDAIDPLFKDFFSEDTFIDDVEDLLTTLKTQIGKWKEPNQGEEMPLEEDKYRFREEEAHKRLVSFIGIEIDNQSVVATKYGDQIARNLCRGVGLRIMGQQRLYTNPEHRRLYHIYADRFYLLLKDMTLAEARNKARQLKEILEGDYRVEARQFPAERFRLPEGLLEIPNVTLRLGVTAFTYSQLKELLQRYPDETAVANTRAEIMHALDETLNLGQQEGGNVITSWDTDSWGYIRWSPAR